ncbi:VCBS domain-containing protein [Algibacillus agarilyticus]|uniref:VCBS domain-containing protein n=1 Tax=Algibacillus agarilyticus TaxID=2234133 RepID=UPI000DD00D96|nr:VCBS domain-containing protein [Algibacillus agarilyticus]
MKKQILALSMIAALSACEIDNSAAKKVAANFNNEFKTEVGFFGTTGKGLDVELTTGHGSASGVIGVTDVNYGEADPDYTLIPEAMYGTFTMTEAGDGAWTYDLDETNAEVAAIMDNPNGTLTDSITLTSLDGTTSEINFIIKGLAPDLEAEFQGSFVANVAMNQTDAIGLARVYDQNFDQSSFMVVTEDDTPKSKYGSFTISADGVWNYKLDNTLPELQVLVEPEDFVEETFTIMSKDGTTKEFSLRVTGAPLNFAAKLPSLKDETPLLSIITKDNGGITTGMREQGKLTFRAKVTPDAPSKAGFGVIGSRYNSEKRRVAHVRASFDGIIEMYSPKIEVGGSYLGKNYERDPVSNNILDDYVIFDQPHEAGKWFDIEITWQKNSGLPALLTMKINGETVSSSHDAIPADPTQPFLAQTLASYSLTDNVSEIQFTMPKNANNGGVGAVFIDDIKIYDDPNADALSTPIFEDDFQDTASGDKVTDRGSPFYKSKTTDNVIAVIEL